MAVAVTLLLCSQWPASIGLTLSSHATCTCVRPAATLVDSWRSHPDLHSGQLLPPLERRSERHGFALPDADICFANDTWANTEDPKKERIILALP